MNTFKYFQNFNSYWETKSISCSEPKSFIQIICPRLPAGVSAAGAVWCEATRKVIWAETGGAEPRWWAGPGRLTAHRIRTRLETNLRDLWRCTITEKAPTRTFSWLKVATNTLRIDQETKLSLNRRKPMDVTLCWRNKYLKGWAVWLAHWAQYPNFSSTYLGLIPVNSILSKE